MGGEGSGRPPSVQTIIARNAPVLTPVGNGVFIPDHSGDFSVGKVVLAPTKDTDIANKLYVDSQISGENHWDMSGDATNIYPHVAGIRVSGASINISGGTIYTAGSNVGIGTTSPTEKLEVEGKILANGTRPVVIDGSNTGSISKQGSAGGWAFGYEFKGSTGTNLGGFGAYGTDNSLNRFYIGTYNTNERVTILNNGNVGIGTTTPSALLSVGASPGGGLSTNTGQILLYNAGNGPETKAGIEFQSWPSDSGYGAKIYTDNSNNNLGIATRYNSATWTQRLVVNEQTGNVGIGTTSPSKKLSIVSSGAGQLTTAIFSNSDTTADNYNFINVNQPVASGGSYSAYLGTNTSGVLKLNSDSPTASHLCITTTGLVGIGTASPPEKLSILSGNIRTMTSGYGYTWRVSGDTDDAYIKWTTGTSMEMKTYNVPIILSAGNAQRMVVTSGGKVGIGTASPTEKLTISGGNVLLVSGAILYIPGLKKIDGTTPAADGDTLKFEASTGRIYGG